MNTPPKVSVLLPFYQAAQSLKAAIESILHQTLQEWELLLIDNNADVHSRSIARHYALLDKRITFLHESRQGIAHALNCGLSQARAPFIARLDADDLALPERLQRQFKFLQENPQIGLVACRCRFSGDEQQAEGYRQFVHWQNSLLSPRDHYLNRFVESPVAHPAVMFRRELVQQWGGYSTRAVPEDYELWLRWMSRGVQFTKLTDELLLWQDHPDRLSRTHPHYSSKAFLEVKMLYLAQWLHQRVFPRRKIVICGASAEIRAKARLLTAHQILIWGYTDVKKRSLHHERFIPISQLTADKDYFFVNLISKRGVGQQIRELLNQLGFLEEQDFILAA